MRRAFITALIELADSNRKIVLLTADLGYSVVEPFALRFPDRFLNVGVAEQNMIGIATGMAEAGWVPFVYSIVPFSVLRPYEFIRNGPIGHQLPVRIVGVGAGVEYGHNGLSHYGLEDIGVLRIQPGITLVVPADCRQTQAALAATWNLSGPVYYRLSKDAPEDVPGLNGCFNLGSLNIVMAGDDVGIVVIGSTAHAALKAGDILRLHGISGSVALVACVHPPPRMALLEFIRKFKLVVTVEAHYITGGVGSLVAELIAEDGQGCRLKRIGVQTLPVGKTGSNVHMLEKLGVTGAAIAEAVLAERRYL